MPALRPDDRVACQGSELDLTAITQRTSLDVISEARGLCASCPALGACLTYLETTEVAGLAGGMLPRQRRRWRLRNRYVTEHVGLAQVSEAHELHGAVLDGLRLRDGNALTREARELVRRLTVAGLSADEIAARVNDPGLRYRTIKHIRNRYLDDPVTKARRSRSDSNIAAAAHRRAVRQWAIEVGIDIPADPTARLPLSVMHAYREAHTASA